MKIPPKTLTDQPRYAAEPVHFDGTKPLTAPPKRPWHAPVFTEFPVKSTRHGTGLGNDGGGGHTSS